MALTMDTVASVNGLTVTTTQGYTLTRIGNKSLREGDTIYTDGKYVYGMEGSGGKQLPILPSNGIPLITVGRELKYSTLNGLIKEIINIESIDADVNVDKYVLAVGKHRIWLIIGAEIKKEFFRLRAVSLDGKDKISTGSEGVYSKLLDVNVDYDGNLLMLIVKEGREYSEIYATKNEEKYWSTKTDSVAEGRINKNGSVDYIIDKKINEIYQSNPHEVDMFKTVDVPPNIQYCYSKEEELKQYDNYELGFLLGDERNNALTYAYMPEKGYGFTVVCTNYSSFNELLNDLNKSLLCVHWKSEDPPIFTYSEDGMSDDEKFFYNKISGSDIKQVDYTNRYSYKIMHNNEILYNYVYESYGRSLVCTKNGFDIEIRKRRGDAIDGWESPKHRDYPDGDNDWSELYIIYKRGTSEQREVCYGQWLSRLEIQDSRTPIYNTSMKESYTIQIGEDDKRNPINADVKCENLPQDLGYITLNGKSIYIEHDRPIATRIRNREFIMTQSGLYLNGEQISDYTINSLENACIEYIHGTNKLKNWKNVKA